MKKIFWLVGLVVLSLFLMGLAGCTGKEAETGEEAGFGEESEEAEEIEGRAAGLEMYNLEQIKAMSSSEVLEIALETAEKLRKQQEEGAKVLGWDNCVAGYKKPYEKSDPTDPTYTDSKGWVTKTILGKEVKMCLRRSGREGEDWYNDNWDLGWLTWNKVAYLESYDPKFKEVGLSEREYKLWLWVPTGKDEEGQALCTLCGLQKRGTVDIADASLKLKCGEETGELLWEMPC